MALVCLSMTSAWQKAEKGPLTSSPARQLASSDTTIFCSDRVLLTTTQVAIPATAITIPTTMATNEAVLRMSSPPVPTPPLWAGGVESPHRGRPGRGTASPGQGDLGAARSVAGASLGSFDASSTSESRGDGA